MLQVLIVSVLALHGCRCKIKFTCHSRPALDSLCSCWHSLQQCIVLWLSTLNYLSLSKLKLHISVIISYHRCSPCTSSVNRCSLSFLARSLRLSSWCFHTITTAAVMFITFTTLVTHITIHSGIGADCFFAIIPSLSITCISVAFWNTARLVALQNNDLHM